MSVFYNPREIFRIKKMGIGKAFQAKVVHKRDLMTREHFSEMKISAAHNQREGLWNEGGI